MLRFLKLAATGLLLSFLLFHSALSENTFHRSSKGVDSSDYGSIIRVKTVDGENVKGCFKGWNPGYLKLRVKDRDTIIQKCDIQIVWVRKRGLSSGFKTGFMLGGIMSGIITYTMARNNYKNNNNEFGPPEKIISFTAGAFFGGLMVGGFFALVGNSFPKWGKIYVKNNPKWEKFDTLSTLSSSTFSKIGEFQVLLNFSRGYSLRETEGGIIGLNLRLANLTSENTAIGPEFGHFNLGKQTTWSDGNDDERVKLYGLFFQWGYRMKNINPYLITGIGIYFRDELFSGFSYGVGLRKPLNGTNKNFIIEGRIHQIQNYDSYLNFYTIQAGLSWMW